VRLDAAVHKEENSAAALLSSDLVCEHTDLRQWMESFSLSLAQIGGWPLVPCLSTLLFLGHHCGIKNTFCVTLQ